MNVPSLSYEGTPCLVLGVPFNFPDYFLFSTRSACMSKVSIPSWVLKTTLLVNLFQEPKRNVNGDEQLLPLWCSLSWFQSKRVLKGEYRSVWWKWPISRVPLHVLFACIGWSAQSNRNENYRVTEHCQINFTNGSKNT